LLGFARQTTFRAGMDSTGMSLQHSTHYYKQQLEHFRKKKKRKPGRPRKRRVKKHQYNNFLCDLDAQLVLAVKLVRGRKSDNPMLIPTLRKARSLFHRISSVDADKGFDAEYNHKFVQEIVGADDHIKLKNNQVPVYKTKGTARKKVKQQAKNKRRRPRRNHRNKAESIMFVIKKCFGEHLTAKKAINQRKQMRFKIIAYNGYRKAKITFYYRISMRPKIQKILIISFGFH